MQRYEPIVYKPVRIVELEGKLWYCGSDIGKVLGYKSKAYDSMTRHCKANIRLRIPHPQSYDKTIEMCFISEEQVKEWVESEIRRSVYAKDTSPFVDAFMRRLHPSYKPTSEKKQKQKEIRLEAHKIASELCRELKKDCIALAVY